MLVCSAHLVQVNPRYSHRHFELFLFGLSDTMPMFLKHKIPLYSVASP